MKLLTLNVHGWLEIHQIPKIYRLAHFIVEEGIDVITLQEVNQFMHSPQAQNPEGFLGENRRPLRQDNYALILNRFIKELTGRGYYWGWAEAHIGFDRYDEGVALLSREEPSQLEMLDLAPAYGYREVPRRVALAARLGSEEEGIWLASTHLSWWQREGTFYFQDEFESLHRQLGQLAGDRPVLLAGDFNAPATATGQGYDLVLSHGWTDTFTTAEQVSGEATVHKAISGWDGLAEAQRIDYVFARGSIAIQQHSVVFPDQDPETALSDHSGLYLSLTISSTDPRP